MAVFVDILVLSNIYLFHLLTFLLFFGFFLCYFLVDFICKYFESDIETGQSFDNEKEDTFYSFQASEFDNTDVPYSPPRRNDNDEDVNDVERIMDGLLRDQAERNRRERLVRDLHGPPPVRPLFIYLGSTEREFGSAFCILFSALFVIIIFSFFCGYLLHRLCHDSLAEAIGLVSFATVFGIKSLGLEMKS